MFFVSLIVTALTAVSISVGEDYLSGTNAMLNVYFGNYDIATILKLFIATTAEQLCLTTISNIHNNHLQLYELIVRSSTHATVTPVSYATNDVTDWWQTNLSYAYINQALWDHEHTSVNRFGQKVACSLSTPGFLGSSVNPNAFPRVGHGLVILPTIIYYFVPSVPSVSSDKLNNSLRAGKPASSEQCTKSQILTRKDAQ